MCIIMASCQAVSNDKAGSSKDFETNKTKENEEEVVSMQDKIRALENEALGL